MTELDKKAQEAIVAVCNEVAELLVRKNTAYGSSVLDPMRVFSRASMDEQFRVRIDDKLSRIQTSGVSGADEDTTLDLIGYLIMWRVANKLRDDGVLPCERKNGDL